MDDDSPSNPPGPNVTLTEALADHGEGVSNDVKGLRCVGGVAAVDVAVAEKVDAPLPVGKECLHAGDEGCAIPLAPRSTIPPLVLVVVVVELLGEVAGEDRIPSRWY